MTILELKEQIIKNQLSNVYVFEGEEIGIMNIYLKEMSNKLSLPISRKDSVLEVLSSCRSTSLFGSSTGFYVIRNDLDIQKQDKFWDTLIDDIGKSTIVLLYDKVDSRLKFGKYFKDRTVKFEKLAPNVLKSYIKKEINLADANIDKLIELCGGNYDMCMLEIDKIRQYCDYKFTNVISNSVPTENMCFIELLGRGVIYQPQETDVFKFTDSVCTKRYKDMFILEEMLRSQGVSSIVTLGTLYNSMKTILLIQCCETKDICETTGLDNRQVYFNKKYVGKWDTGKLVYAVKLISKTVDDIKNGRIDDMYATKYVLSMII